jgi:hypothetical protein
MLESANCALGPLHTHTANRVPHLIKAKKNFLLQAPVVYAAAYRLLQFRVNATVTSPPTHPHNVTPPRLKGLFHRIKADSRCPV